MRSMSISVRHPRRGSVSRPDMRTHAALYVALCERSELPAGAFSALPRCARHPTWPTLSPEVQQCARQANAGRPWGCRAPEAGRPRLRLNAEEEAGEELPDALEGNEEANEGEDDEGEADEGMDKEPDVDARAAPTEEQLPDLRRPARRSRCAPRRDPAPRLHPGQRPRRVDWLLVSCERRRGARSPV